MCKLLCKSIQSVDFTSKLVRYKLMIVCLLCLFYAKFTGCFVHLFIYRSKFSFHIYTSNLYMSKMCLLCVVNLLCSLT